MMNKKYSRLRFDERIEIEKLLSHKKSYTDIAGALNRDKSTIQREVNKQGRGNYKAMDAERIAVGSVSNRRSGKNKIKQNIQLEYPAELDTIPSKIEFVTKEIIQEADTTFTYYVFKFKTDPPHWAAEDGWMIGCVGPYRKFDNPYAWPKGTFSRFNHIDSVSTKEEAIWCHDHVLRNKN
ncbi:MAG TPA: helix-turn-helix domain-containing protein [Chitinophagaceae bacterium]|nr:helix-turn-helix domain-containing protein [Chitinophagaceae bacterium]